MAARRWARVLAGLAVVLSVTLAGCTAGGVRYVPAPAGAGASAAPAVSALPEYQLNVGDQLRIDVLWHPELTTEQVVRPDGRITATGFGDIQALGRTAAQIDSELTSLLAGQYVRPQVSVTLQKTAPLEVYGLGEVRTAGAQTFIPGMRMLDALGRTGGITEWGQMGTVLVIKRRGPNGEPIAYRVNAKKAIKTGGRMDNPPLDPYDIVYVPRSALAQASIKLNELLTATTAPMNIYLRGWDVWRKGATRTVQVIRPENP